jgi:hypothetical protein
MKHHLFLSFAISLMIFLSSAAKAQDEIRRITITGGTGISPGFSTGNVYPVATSTPSSAGHYPLYYAAGGTSITPLVNITGDYRLAKRWSVGLAGSYQSEKVTQTLNQGNYITGTDFLSRSNIAARALFHIGKISSNLFDQYAGIRVGCSSWHDVYTSNAAPNSAPVVDSPFLANPNTVSTSFQVLYGISMYYRGIVGFHLEAAIGSPYLLEVGLNLRFGNKLNIPDATSNTGK